MSWTTSAIILVTLVTSSYSQTFTNVSLTTSRGPIVGLRWNPNPYSGASYDAFLGIPYGRIPARFQPAVLRSNWTTPLLTQHDGPACPQPFMPYSEDCLYLNTPVPAVLRSNWTTPLLTQHDGPACPQPFMPYSEDCLYLNVFTPVNASVTPGQFPVVAFIHGSAFTYGSSSSQLFGPDFLVPQGVILVTMNYRLGAAGFLSLGTPEAPGNLGLLDTQLALRWIQKEISHFGGDPDRVTLAGQSAGSVMTMFHYLSNTSSAMFQRAIAHSGSALSTWGHVTADEAIRRAKLLANAVGCDKQKNITDVLSCLQTVDISTIVHNQNITLSKDINANGNTLPFVPVIDTSFGKPPFFTDSIPNLVKEASSRSKPLIAGFTTEEGIFLFGDDKWKHAEDNVTEFIPWRFEDGLNSEQQKNLGKLIENKYFPQTVDQNKVLDVINLYTDYLFAYPVIDLAKMLPNLTYVFVFGYDGSWAPIPPTARYHVTGVSHGADMYYIFYGGQDLGDCWSNRNNLLIKEKMVEWWTSFVKNGVPSPSPSTWSPVSGGQYLLLEALRTASLVNASDVDPRHYDFWASLNTSSLSNSSPRIYINFGSIFVTFFIVLVEFVAHL